MTRKRVTHSEEWWATAPSHTLRCNGQYKTTGLPCRREALAGTSVCREHGGLAPATRAAAAMRIQMTSDEAARHLVAWMNDPKVDMRERVKIAHDMLDRGGLAAAQVHKIMPITEDPIEALFKSLLGDPDGLLQPEADRPALPAAPVDADDLIGVWEPDDTDEDVVEGELVPMPPPHAAATKKNPTRPPKHIREGLSLI